METHSVADPGCPRRVGERQPMIWQIFAENCMETNN